MTFFKTEGLAMQLNKKQIKFHFTKRHLKLFTSDQHQHIASIEKAYAKLLSKCTIHAKLPISCSHKEWITSRVKLHMNTSLMRLLYLTEGFCDTAQKFNAPATAVLIKAVVEIPLHMGYLVWILCDDAKQDPQDSAKRVGLTFNEIREELDKISFGIRDKNTQLTFKGKISAKEYYEKADAMVKKHFIDQPSSINIFETMYKEANATGHHNYEALMLCGIQNKYVWNARDRTELFQFFSNNLFQFFMHCDAILGMTSIFLSAIEHYLAVLPDYFDS